MTNTYEIDDCRLLGAPSLRPMLYCGEQSAMIVSRLMMRYIMRGAGARIGTETVTFADDAAPDNYFCYENKADFTGITWYTADSDLILLIRAMAAESDLRYKGER